MHRLCAEKVKSPFPHLNPRQTRKLAFSGIHVINPAIFCDMIDLPYRFPVIYYYLFLCHREKSPAPPKRTENDWCGKTKLSESS
jgi:hypothetical protein